MKNTKREIFAYIFAGAITTAVNFLCYFLLYNVLNFSNVASVFSAWLASAAVSFTMNKVYVFESKNFWLKELALFVMYRTASGISEVVIMYFTVDLLNLNATLCKISTNVFVIAVNYAAGKFRVFRKAD